MRGRTVAMVLLAAAVSGPVAASKARVPLRATGGEPGHERPTGCTRGGPDFRTSGPSNRKRIAISFDDGPGPFTRKVLRVLGRFDSHATFFALGQELPGPGRAATMRRILDEGSEIANHSMHHESLPSSGSLITTSRRIEKATGFEPCLFRPPGGNVDAALVERADARGMTTVTWDVDPRDWSNPGSGAIAAGVLAHAHNGAIVVMHDGGGARGQTVAALPSILSRLRHRGFELVTVTELLGNEFTYGS